MRSSKTSDAVVSTENRSSRLWLRRICFKSCSFVIERLDLKVRLQEGQSEGIGRPAPRYAGASLFTKHAYRSRSSLYAPRCRNHPHQGWRLLATEMDPPAAPLSPMPA